MLTLPRSRLSRALAIRSFVLLGLVTLGAGPVAAQVLENDVASDSEIVLLEEAESGAYQRYLVKASTRDGRTLLATDKDGIKAEFEVKSDDYLSLWRDVLKNGLETMMDASLENAPPDQSQFTVKYRVWQTAGGFTAYGVDTLPDDRYRKIVRAILAFADQYFRTRG